jgi:transcriptional regulator with GAF, ATPase, and Fis domain
MTPFDPEADLFVKGKEFLQMFNKVAEFTKELLLENERLEMETQQLEKENEGLRNAKASEEDMVVLEGELTNLQREKMELLNRYHQVEEENKDFVSRYIEIEEENNNMANLYVASYQLHSTLDFQEVISIIMEIIINLIGAEVFGLLLLDEKTATLSAVAMEGFMVDEFPRIRSGDGIIGQAVTTGQSYFHEGGTMVQQPLEPPRPIVCVPLKIKERVIGAVVIYRLLRQKEKFVNVDYELFSLLAGHAATAIFSAKLYSESERKLHTIQGFIDLLTK